MSFEKFYQEYLQQDEPDYTVSLYDRLKWLYDKAHRQGKAEGIRLGWEQGMLRAAEIAETHKDV